MNYKIVLTATMIAAGLTACDSRNSARDRESVNVDQTKGSIQSGATSAGNGDAMEKSPNNYGQNSVATSNKRNQTGVDARTGKPTSPTSGASSPDTMNIPDSRQRSGH